MITYLKNAENGGLTTLDNWQKKCWISITSPNQDEINYILNELKVPSDFLYDIQDDDERPRVEIEDGWTLIIMRIPIRRDSSISFFTVPLGIVIKDDIVATICFHQNDVMPDFIIYTQRKSIRIDNNINFLLRLFLSTSVWFQKYLKQINANVRMAEKELERSVKNEDLKSLLKIQNCLVYFITSLKGNSILLSKLKNLKSNEEIDLDLLEDVEIELKQAIETTNVHSNILAGTMNAYATIVSNNVNDIMKKLTSITVILMIPTLVASIYGMNLYNSLETSQYGFLSIILIATFLTALGTLYLRRRNFF